MLTLDELRTEVEAGRIDTVVAAFTDMQGRLLGKREQAEYFLAESAGHGLEGCNYLLALDMEMDPQPGYGMASWDKGYGDFHLVPDPATLRRIPWLEGTAFVLCDELHRLAFELRAWRHYHGGAVAQPGGGKFHAPDRALRLHRGRLSGQLPDLRPFGSRRKMVEPDLSTAHKPPHGPAAGGDRHAIPH